ncbi:hypothetical protein P3T27_008148 [Kitasatospora sp. MAA19]|uniref:hypothetical protein n=1 Tax=Kitasatospora sp. MAA19 TaxID=3035090 RepID=UPI002473DFA3|nr:hypothetical protein [Kitasatospora sp. MAA19]MDH6711390.1 hypothetical protein [Kitasatospora sp. MAA19]
MVPGRPVAAALAAALSAILLAGCSSGPSDAELAYVGDYAGHPHLRVTGYPVTGTLGLVQQAVWRLADGSADRLEKLAASEGSAAERRDTAAAWVRDYQQGAKGSVTADFGDDPANRQTVVLSFHGTGQVKELQLRLDGRDGGDGWRILMR